MESRFIRTYVDSLDPDVCKQIINKFEQDDRKFPGRTISGYNKIKTSTDLRISSLEDWSEYDKEIYNTVSNTFEEYRLECPEINYIADNYEIVDTGYQIQRYQANGKDSFYWHIDNGSPETCHRILAAIIYLNDVEEGGETQFYGNPKSIKPQEGLTLWFPPTFEYPHCGTRPISGPKYIITTFMVYKSQ